MIHSVFVLQLAKRCRATAKRNQFIRCRAVQKDAGDIGMGYRAELVGDRMRQVFGRFAGRDRGDRVQQLDQFGTAFLTRQDVAVFKREPDQICQHTQEW